MIVKLLFALIILVDSLSIAQILKQADVQLYDAIAEGNLDSVKKALESGADPNAYDSGGTGNMLQLAVITRNGKVEIVNELLRAGAIIDGSPPYNSPLYYAAAGSREDIIKCLIDANAELNVKEDTFSYVLRSMSEPGVEAKGRGHTPLHVACRHSNRDSVKLLLKHNANYRLCNYEGIRPYDFAPSEILEIFKEHIDLQISQSAKEISSIIIPDLAKIIAQYVHGFEQSPLRFDKDGREHEQLLDAIRICSSDVNWFTRRQNLSKLKKLLDSKANVNFVQEYDHYSKGHVSAIALAVTGNNLEVVKLLVQARADLNCEVSDALHAAVGFNQIEILRFLLDSGAQIKNPEYQYNALIDAINECNVKAVDMLLERNKKTGEVDISKLHYGNKKIALLGMTDRVNLNQIVDLVAANFNEYVRTIAKSFKAEMPHNVAKLIMSYMFWHTRYLENNVQLCILSDKSAHSKCVIS